MQLCFATNNQHKIREVAGAIGNRFSILSLADVSVREELPETTDTIEGNSLQKALYVFRRTNIPCFADDSGLEVELLGGAPGVHSAYYSGERNDEKNIEKLLTDLRGAQNRRARFRTVITLAGHGQPRSFEGIIEGEITTEKKGSGGFGYDPVFRPVGYTKTFGEMSLEEKNRISHRSIAVQKLVSYLKQLPIG